MVTYSPRLGLWLGSNMLTDNTSDKTEAQQTAGLLASYRIIDLCDEKGLLCTKLIVDLGIDIIAIETPSDTFTRTQEPCYHDQAETVIQRLQTAGVAQDTQTLLEQDHQLHHRGHDLCLTYPVTGPAYCMGHILNLSETCSAMRPAPSLGQHNDNVYGELLGITEAASKHYTQDQVFY